ncbi:hypothetical protein JJQ72_06935 [Paenibacillus sp. F411]|uniref:hypothetical protein n=1 Tax=Paenibacillus sp. F411 TaxID=2820239 RepID=UPI001AAF83D5|nr:hypothetical protein [Paenibacillus sp. F411]MBO2943711.1 hypothetical protein [Paenibacillus sp. F411]
MRRVFRREEGAVSIFLMIALSVVFMFVAVFIDYARIAAMKVQGERLAHAAVRSVMSAYDPQLQQNYGLYAIGETRGDLIMGKTLNESLKPSPRADAFPLLPLRLDSSALQLQRPLGTYDIFNRQISEDMKYKAPIDFTLEMLSKFKPMSQSMKEASSTFDVLKKLGKLYDQREKELDDMLEKQRKAGQQAPPLSRLVLQPPGSQISDEVLGGAIATAGDAASQYQDYMNKSAEDASRESDEKLYTDLLRKYLEGTASMSSTLAAGVRGASSRHEALLQEAEEHFKKAQQLNEEMKQVIEEAESRSASSGYDALSHQSVPGTDSSSAGDAPMIQSIRQQTGKLIHHDSFLDSFQAEINRQKNEWGPVVQKLDALAGSLGSSAAASSVSRASRSVEEYIQEYSDPGTRNKLSQKQLELEQLRSSDKERKALEGEARGKLKQAERWMAALHGGKESGEVQAQFKELKRYYDDSLSFNAVAAEEDRRGTEWESDPYDAGHASMDQMDGSFAAMGGLMDGVMDELFQNEYAVHYFSHYDITELSGLSDPGTLSGFTPPDLKEQEVEYILYGFHNGYANIAAAYGEIFASRLAIRTMEGFVVNSNKGNPLLILAAAILYGVEKAIEDMIALSTKGSVELSRYMPVEMTYRDHLRLFLFLHSHNDKKMSRMLALIRFHTGINPAERATYASGEIELGMKLWFLPGVTKALGAVMDHGDDAVKGSEYIITRRADFSY